MRSELMTVWNRLGYTANDKQSKLAQDVYANQRVPDDFVIYTKEGSNFKITDPVSTEEQTDKRNTPKPTLETIVGKFVGQNSFDNDDKETIFAFAYHNSKRKWSMVFAWKDPTDKNGYRKVVIASEKAKLDMHIDPNNLQSMSDEEKTAEQLRIIFETGVTCSTTDPNKTISVKSMLDLLGKSQQNSDLSSDVEHLGNESAAIKNLLPNFDQAEINNAPIGTNQQYNSATDDENAGQGSDVNGSKNTPDVTSNLLGAFGVDAGNSAPNGNNDPAQNEQPAASPSILRIYSQVFSKAIKEMPGVIKDTFDETFYVDEYAAIGGQPITWKTRAKAFVEWPGGKGIARILGFVLFGFLLALLKNPLKFTQILFSCVAQLCKGIVDGLNNALATEYPHGQPAGVITLTFFTSLALNFLSFLNSSLYLAVRATLSPVASYEAAKKEGGTLLGLVSIAFSTLFITGSLLLLGPFALFIAGKIAGPLAVQTLTLLMAELIAKLGMTSFVANVAGFLGLYVAPVTASMCVAAAMLVIATVHRLPTLIAGIFTGFGFFGGGAGGKYVPLPGDDNNGQKPDLRPRDNNNPHTDRRLSSSGEGFPFQEEDELDKPINQGVTSADGNPNSNAAAMNKFGIHSQQENGSSTSVGTDHNALNDKSLSRSNVPG